MTFIMGACPRCPRWSRLRGSSPRSASGMRLRGSICVAFSALKTYDPPLSGAARAGDRVGHPAREVPRHLGAGAAPGLPPGPGRLAALEGLPARRAGPAGQGPARAPRVRLDDGSGFDLTEAGTQRKLAVYVVADPDVHPDGGDARPGPAGRRVRRGGARRRCWPRLAGPS